MESNISVAEHEKIVQALKAENTLLRNRIDKALKIVNGVDYAYCYEVLGNMMMIEEEDCD